MAEVDMARRLWIRGGWAHSTAEGRGMFDKAGYAFGDSHRDGAIDVPMQCGTLLQEHRPFADLQLDVQRCSPDGSGGAV